MEWMHFFQSEMAECTYTLQRNHSTVYCTHDPFFSRISCRQTERNKDQDRFTLIKKQLVYHKPFTHFVTYQPDCAPSHMVGNTLLIFSTPSTGVAPGDVLSPVVMSVTVGPSDPWPVCTPGHITNNTMYH